jgi:predicted RNA-binding Zn-ribbon protein involved in translation (DUF1610 family)
MVFDGGQRVAKSRCHESKTIRGTESMTAKLQSKNDECPLCGSDAIYENSADDLTRRVYECPKCGTYEITDESRSDLEGIADNPIALEAYRQRIKADNEKKVATLIERESKKKNDPEPK